MQIITTEMMDIRTNIPPRQSENTISAKRIGWIDWAKASGILLVVMGHSHYSVKEIEPMIFMIHMPLFFLVSGYLYNHRKSFKQIANECVKGLLVPYVLYNVFFAIYWIFLGFLKYSMNQPYDWIACVITPGWHTLFGISLGIFDGPTWFLLALLWCKVLSYLLHNGSWRMIITFIMIWSSLLMIRTRYDVQYPYAIDCACAGFIWFEVGKIIRHFKEKMLIPKIIYFLSIPIGAIICFEVMNYQGQCNYILARTGGIVGVIGTAAGLATFLIICKLLERYNNPVIIMMSKASIVVMCLHMFVNGWLELVLHYQNHLLYTFIVDLSLTIALTSLFPIIKKHMPALIGGRK